MSVRLGCVCAARGKAGQPLAGKAAPAVDDVHDPIAGRRALAAKRLLLVAGVFLSGLLPGHPALTQATAAPPSDTAPAKASPAAKRLLEASDRGVRLPDARRMFQAKPIPQEKERTPVDKPPPKVFKIVHYDAPAGKLAAYLTPDPGDGKKHPAIVWITGGDCNSIGDVWSSAPAENDQTASAYRKEGLVMMFPALRGGNDNPGKKEAFLGEVDDVVAAADFLAAQDYVDPKRIYLGGHSTGGTLALLVAESTDKFRAVFSFGPAADVRGYAPVYSPFDKSDLAEALVRSPVYWMGSIRSPTFVFEGDGGNVDSLRLMKKFSKNPRIRFHEIKGADHFTTLAPTNRLIARKILDDQGPAANLMFTPEELNKPFDQ